MFFLGIYVEYEGSVIVGKYIIYMLWYILIMIYVMFV